MKSVKLLKIRVGIIDWWLEKFFKNKQSSGDDYSALQSIRNLDTIREITLRLMPLTHENIRLLRKLFASSFREGSREEFVFFPTYVPVTLKSV